MLENLYEEVLEVDERVITHRDDCRISPELKASWKMDTTLNNEKVLVRKEIDLDSVRSSLIELKNKGINSIAILLLHSYS